MQQTEMDATGRDGCNRHSWMQQKEMDATDRDGCNRQK